MEAAVQCRETWSLRPKSEFWIQPRDVADVAHEPDFTSVDVTQTSVDCFVEGETEDEPALRTTPCPTHLDLSRFYADLHKAGGRSVILSVLPRYCEEFRNPEAVSEDQSEGNEEEDTETAKAVAEVFRDHDYSKKPQTVTEQQELPGLNESS
ncbi:hypothetical protein Q5P01_013026 [Channa striata]|uniref:Uncharacterized protein n=1 Tax=Channa striata TaxID=64152 RepID=A0AA88SKW6_CHASR|nr:hypothetical protein Q5P01_013026 [Channa striata]